MSVTDSLTRMLTYTHMHHTHTHTHTHALIHIMHIHTHAYTHTHAPHTYTLTHTVPEENVATPQRDACTIEGQVKDVLLNGDTENYSGEQGYTTHTITRDNSKGITVQLNHPYIINCIRMLLWDRDNRSYSYFVQVSYSIFQSRELCSKVPQCIHMTNTLL